MIAIGVILSSVVFYLTREPSPENQPVAYNQSVITDEDNSVAITLTATDPDNDPLTYFIVSGPSDGTLTGTAPNVIYNPKTGYTGLDNFTFKVNDGKVDSNIATVSITVNPVTENIQKILLTKVATEKGVAKENVKICFYKQTENDNILAVGAVSRRGGTLIFFYDISSHTMTKKEVDYATETDNEFRAFSIVATMISPFTGVEIVPFEFSGGDDRYDFTYYDGYSTMTLHWSGGLATVYLDNEEVKWGPRLP